MIITYKNFNINLAEPIDISIPMHTGEKQVNCYHAPPFRTEPVIMGNFIGDTAQGGAVNYKNVFLNPHGNGTHTECLAHICNKKITLNQALQKYHFIAQVLTVVPALQKNGDMMIELNQIETKLMGETEAIILRTLPNSILKMSTNYSGKNPPYLHHSIAQYLCENNIKHLLIDLPSLDREQDDGKLLAHRAFFYYPENPRYDASITELIYVPDTVEDGIYFLNLQIASFELDAAPAKPVLFKLIAQTAN